MQIGEILVPVDFSDSSLRALEAASSIARAFGASVDALHVWEAPIFVPAESVVALPQGQKSVLELIQSNSQEAMDEFLTKAAKQGVSVRSTKNQSGSPARAIVDAAKEGGYDLIVIGTHGRTGMSRLVLGSVAEQVVRYATCPVLVARAQS